MTARDVTFDPDEVTPLRPASTRTIERSSSSSSRSSKGARSGGHAAAGVAEVGLTSTSS